MAPTMKEVKNRISADSFSVKDGVFTVRHGFFYRHGQSSEDFAQKVEKEFASEPGFRIVEHGEFWAPFKGGAPIAKQSHWFVRFTFTK